MNMRKHFIIIIIVLLFALAACSSRKKFEMTSELLSQNLGDYEDKRPRNAVFVSDLSDYEYVNTSDLSLGLLIVQDEDLNEGVWSLFIQDFISPPDSDTSFRMINAFQAHYVELTDEDGLITVYDVFGKVVLPKGPYSNVDIEIETRIEDGEEKCYEIVSYYRETEDGSYVYETKKFLLNTDLKSRTEAEDEEEGGVLLPDESDLAVFGLEDYRIKGFGTHLSVYKGDELAYHLQLDNPDAVLVADGKLLVQKSHLLDNLSEEYSYLSGGNKYYLETYMVDLRSGKEKNLKLDYVINSVTPFYDAEGVYKYGYATISEIIERNRSLSPKMVLIGANGKILTEFGFNILALKKLSPTRFYNPISSYVYNEKLLPEFGFKSMPYFIESETAFLVSDDKYGVVGADGEILVSFKYDYIYNSFLDGKTLARDEELKYCVIGLDGSKRIIDETVSLISRGLILNVIEIEEYSLYEYRILDYNLTRKATIEASFFNANPFRSTSNVYGNYFYASFDSTYVLIDRTAE